MQVYLAKLSMYIMGNILRETGLSGTTSYDLYQCSLSLSSVLCIICVCAIFVLFYKQLFMLSEVITGNIHNNYYYVTIIIDLCMLQVFYI